MKLKLLFTGTGFLILFLMTACKEVDEPTLQTASKWEVFTIKNGLSSDTILSLAQDKNGAIWIGAQSGVCKLKNSTTTDFIKVDSGYKVNSIKCYDNYVMIATSIGGYVILNNLWYYVNNKFTNCLDIEYYNAKFWTLYDDGVIYSGNITNGNFTGVKKLYSNGISLWLLGSYGLFQLYPKNLSYSQSEGLASNTCYAMHQNSTELIWAGTYDKEGVSKITTSGVENFKCGFISSIAEDKKGNMWFGSQYYGIYKLETTGNLINYTKLDGLPNNKVTDILVTTDGSIWVSTLGGGIAKLKN